MILCAGLLVLYIIISIVTSTCNHTFGKVVISTFKQTNSSLFNSVISYKCFPIFSFSHLSVLMALDSFLSTYVLIYLNMVCPMCSGS